MNFRILLGVMVFGLALSLAQAADDDPPVKEKSIAELKKDLTDKDVITRRKAARAFNSDPKAAEKAIKELTAATSDKDLAVRFYSLGALGRLGEAGKPAIPTLVGVLKQGKPPILCRQAAVGLARLGRIAVLPLSKLLED